MAVSTKFKMVEEGDRLSPAGARLPKLIEITYRNEVCMYYIHLAILQGHAVAQLVEALRYKSEGRGFDSRWCQWNVSLTSFRPHCGPGVDSASNKNEYQEYFLGVKAAGA